MHDREGYSIHPGVFTPAEMTIVLGALERSELQRTRAGARHVLSVPEVRLLADDERLLPIARGYVGPAAVPYRATLFDKSRAANWLVAWHQDIALPIRRQIDHPAWGPWSRKGGVLHAIAPAFALERVVALRVHLDDSTPDNGPLRVLPGTHTEGVLGDDEIRLRADVVEPVACTVAAGGVIAMRPLTIHASSKSANERPRRVIHIEYAAGTDLGGGIELACG